MASIEDRRLNDENLILAIGKASDMGFRGLSGIDADDWYRNIILEDLEFTADELFVHAFKKLLSSNSGRLPVHKYLAQPK